MQKLSRPHVLFNHDDDHYAALIERQQNVNKDNYTHKDSSFLYTGSTVEVQKEDGSPWTHVTVLRHGLEEHNCRSYKICITKWDVLSQECTDM